MALREGIDRLLGERMTKEQKERIYTVLNLSTETGWEQTLESLGIEENGWIAHPCGEGIDLYKEFPYSAVCFGGNYLIIVDSLNSIRRNKRNANWMIVRGNAGDLVVDSHGNVAAMREIEEVKDACIRIQSNTNEWMDCVFLVSEEEKEKAKDVLQKALNDFWKQGEGWCYENFLEARMVEAGIAFDAYYADVEQ